MKKLKLLFYIILMVAATISCDKRNVEMRFEDVVSVTSGVIPILNIGNTSCEDVALDASMAFAFSSGKADYVNGVFVFESPYTGWPEGLEVTITEGKYVSFTYSSAQYCVGAVIVKGGNASNVFTYDHDVKSDAGLTSPVNASGKPAGLSNLTFCFVECEQLPSLVVGFKSYVNTGYVTSGAYITAFPFVIGGVYKLYLSGQVSTANEVGYLKITDEDADGKLEVRADNTLNPAIHFTGPNLYVGTLIGFTLEYWTYPYPEPRINLTPEEGLDTWIFELP